MGILDTTNNTIRSVESTMGSMIGQGMAMGARGIAGFVRGVTGGIGSMTGFWGNNCRSFAPFLVRAACSRRALYTENLTLYKFEEY
jgi:hypothetical protein